jgi:biotin carboxyl carrier protein
VRELDADTREITVGGVRHRAAWVARRRSRLRLVRRRSWIFTRAPAARAAGAADHGGDLRAPMPGRVRRVARGGRVGGAGQVVLVLEAMKMEHAIRAPRDGGVRAVRGGRPGDAGVELAEIE